MNRSTETVLRSRPALDAHEAARCGAWLAACFGADADAAETALRRASPNPGGAVRLPGLADIRMLDRLAGPAVFDMLLDRVDLPASALVLVGDEASTFDMRPGRDDDLDDVDFGDGLDEVRARHRRRPRTADGCCDTLAVQQQLQAGSVRGLQVRDAWRWLPHLRPVASALDEAMCWHVSLDLLLLPPGGSVDSVLLQPDHVLLVQVFGRTSIQFTDANPEFDERRDGRMGLMPRKPPLRGVRWTAEPGEIIHGNMSQAVGFPLRTARSARGEESLRVNADGDGVGDGGAHQGAFDDATDNAAMSPPSTSGWSGLLCVGLRKPNWGEVLRYRLKVDQRLDPWSRSVCTSAELPTWQREEGGAAAILARYWQDRRDPRLAARTGRLLDLMASTSMHGGTVLILRAGHGFERILESEVRSGEYQRRVGLPDRPARLLLRRHGKTVLELAPQLAGWLEGVLTRKGPFTASDLPRPPMVVERDLWSKRPGGVSLNDKDASVALCRRLLAAGVLQRVPGG